MIRFCLASQAGPTSRFTPGLPALLGYRGTDLPRDLIAAVTVARDRLG